MAGKRRRPGAQRGSICTSLDNHELEESTTARRQQLSLKSFFASTTPSKCAPPVSRANVCQTPPTPPLLADTTNQGSKRQSKLPVETPPFPPMGPLTEKSAKTPPTPLHPKRPASSTLQQVYLDLGQESFGQRLCRQCGMLYMPGVLEDERHHQQMCSESRLGVLWKRRKSAKQVATDCVTPRQRAVQTFPVQPAHKRLTDASKEDDCILLLPPITGSKPVAPQLQYLWEHVVAKDLGLSQKDVTLRGSTIFLYLRHQRVVGFAMTQAISKAYVAQSTGYNAVQTNDAPPEKEWRKAMLGIGILWTHAAFRSQHIATRLVDAARTHAVFGMVVPTSQLAFSSPTQAGWAFAKSYTNGRPRCNQRDEPTPLVYDFASDQEVQ